MNTESVEQKKNESVPKLKADDKNQQSTSTSTKLEGTKLPTSEDKKQSSGSSDIKSHVYSAEKSVSYKEILADLTSYENVDSIISEKKGQLVVFQEMIKPIPREQRRRGKKSPVTPARRRTANIQIKQLEHDIIQLEEDRRSIFKRLTGRVDDEKLSIANKIHRNHSQSDHYLNRNGKRIILNVGKLLNKVRSESINDVIVLVNAAKKEGAKSRSEFQTAFLDFLRKKRYQLYILCTGKESFKKSVVDKFRKALKSWNPRRKDLAL